jgi:hypothetical protein
MNATNKLLSRGPVRVKPRSWFDKLTMNGRCVTLKSTT